MGDKNIIKPQEAINLIAERKKTLEFIPTGFHKLDKYLDGGFCKKELVVIGGGTGVGKSFLAGQIVLNVADKGFKTLYLSLEISVLTIMARWIGGLSEIKPARIIGGLLTKEEFDRKSEAEARLVLLSEFISMADSIYVFREIIQTIKTVKPDLVVIDFIQNIISSKGDEYERLSRIALELQKLAKEVDTCIVILSQLSNRVVREGEKARYLEYKGSGAIAQVCDLGFWLMPDDQGDVYIEKKLTLRELKLVLRKNRRGFSGGMAVLENGNCQAGGYMKKE